MEIWNNPATFHPDNRDTTYVIPYQGKGAKPLNCCLLVLDFTGGGGGGAKVYFPSVPMVNTTLMAFNS